MSATPAIDAVRSFPHGTVVSRLGRLGPAVDAAARRAIACAWLEELVEANGLFTWRGIDARPGRKPHLRGTGPGDVSISHSGDLLFVAASTTRGVGADIEVEPFDAFSRATLVSRMCTPDELRLSSRVDGVRRLRLLADLWTAKEATVKATGEGLARDFRTFSAPAARTPATSGPIACIAVLGPRGRMVRFRPDTRGIAPVATESAA